MYPQSLIISLIVRRNFLFLHAYKEVRLLIQLLTPAVIYSGGFEADWMAGCLQFI